MLQIYDRVLTSQNITTLIALSGLLLGLFIFVSLLEATRASTMARIGDAVEAELTPRVYDSTFQRQLRAPQAQANQPLWDLNQIRQFFSGTGLSALMDLPWFPIFMVCNTRFNFASCHIGDFRANRAPRSITGFGDGLRSSGACCKSATQC
jgi:ATP-binding cassette, subfamily C, bacterial exporter for protease/lipase